MEFEFIKHEHTKILPLRWFANAVEIPAHYLLGKCLWLDDVENYGFRYKVYSKISSKLYKAVFKWGTYYTMDDEK